MHLKSFSSQYFSKLDSSVLRLKHWLIICEVRHLLFLCRAVSLSLSTERAKGKFRARTWLNSCVSVSSWVCIYNLCMPDIESYSVTLLYTPNVTWLCLDYLNKYICKHIHLLSCYFFLLLLCPCLYPIWITFRSSLNYWNSLLLDFSASHLAPFSLCLNQELRIYLK